MSPVQRALCLAALAGALASGAGCGGDPEGVPSAHASRAGSLRSIVYINPLPTNPLWDRIGVCMKAEAAKHEISVEEKGPPGGNVDVQLMQNMLSQAVATKAQAVVTWSLGAAEAFDALFARLRANGGVVATVLSPGATKHQNFDVGTSWAVRARLQVQAIARRAGQQRLGVIWQRSSGSAYSEFVSALKDEVSRHPNVTLVDLRFNEGKFTDDVSITNAMLTTHPEINVLANYSGFPGMLTAIEEKHLVGKVVVFMSADFPDVIKAHADDGLIGGVALTDACYAGGLIVRKLRDAWVGKPVDPVYSDNLRIVSVKEFEELS
jgi:ABC-type sugar transport system substrate-binding protein